MASKLITLPFRPTINLRGGVEAGAKLFVYSTGTTTPVSVYSDSALSIPLTNPVVADAFGVFPDVYYNDTQIVRVVIQQANGTVLSDTDPYVSDAASAEASADAAATSAAAAEAIARPIYANNAAGLAATAEGDFFFVDQGDGTADLYRHDAGPTATAMGRSTIIDPQASGAADLIGKSGGGTVQDALNTIPEVFISPSTATAVRKGSVVRVNNAAGLSTSWLALSDFTYSTVDAAHFKASPDLALISRQHPRTGSPPVPTGYTAAPFSMAYGAGGRISTSIDDDAVFRATYAVAPNLTGTTLNAFYVDPDTGNDANSGKTWALAKATLGSVRTAANAAGVPAVVYIRGNGKCIGRNSGLSHTSQFTVDVSFIGIGKTYLGNVYEAGDVSFSANATYSWVQETATGTMTQPGRSFDLRYTDTLIDDLGREIEAPIEYVAKTSLADVAATPGSYWFDSAGSTYYVHMIGGGAPAMGTDLCVCRSTVPVEPIGANGQTVYIENIHFLGGVVAESYPNARYYLLNVISTGSRANGFYTDTCAEAILKGCVSVYPANDGLNAHNIGANITGITQASPPVVTCSSPHNLENGDQIVIEPTATGASIGMDELLNTTFTVANKTSTTFELSGINATGYGAYTSGGKARIPSSVFWAINCTTFRNTLSVGSNQSITFHENVKGGIVNGLFEAPGRDHVTNINTSECHILGSRFTGYRATSEVNRIVLSTDLAKVALDGVDWGGYVDSATALFSGNATNKIKLINMDLPSNAQVSNVTLDW